MKLKIIKKTIKLKIKLSIKIITLKLKKLISLTKNKPIQKSQIIKTIFIKHSIRDTMYQQM